MASRYRAYVLGGILLGGSITLCHADEFDTFNFHARAAYAYDSNLFREESDDAGSDHVTSLSAGLSINKPYGMQRFRGKGEFTRNEYNEFSGLDHDTREYLLAWDWHLTPRLSGTLSSDQEQKMVDQAFDTNADKRETKNLRTVRVQQLDLNWWLHSNWHLLAEVGKEKKSFDKETDDEDGHEANRWGTGLMYDAGSGRRISFNYLQRDADLEREEDPAELKDDSFDSDEYLLTLVYPFGGDSRIHAELGYVDQTYPTFSERDFSGLVGGLRLEWGFSAKIRLNAGYKRDVISWQRDSGSYAKIDIWSLGAKWAFTVKQQLGLFLEQRHREQHGYVNIGNTEPLRNDHTRVARLNWIWEPTLTTDVIASWFYQRRNSNNNDFDYDAHGFSLSVEQMF